MFVGRNSEINTLLNTYKTKNQHSIVYGNRRVGKTALVTETAKRSGLEFITYECLKSSLRNNLDVLSRQLYEEGLFSSPITFNTFIDLFKYINSLNKHLIVLIDEYPYLYYKNDKNEVDSLFQTVLEKHSSNINIVLSGSHIGMMKDLLRQKNPLFGRVKTVIHLLELNYIEASEFYPNIPNYDKVAFYSIFGGSPFILKQLNYNKSLEDNICDTFLNQTSSVYTHICEGYTTDLATKDSANQIFEVIGNSKLRHNRIEELLHYEHNGLLSKQLNILTDMEFVDKNVPINKVGDNKKTTYYIKNNALKFYFAYVYGKQNILSMIGAKAFFNRYIKESLLTFVSYRFEEIVRTYLSLQVKKEKLDGIYNIGTYYYDDIINKKNGEFDVALELENGFDIIEVKYLKDKVKQSVVESEIQKIKNIKEINVLNVGFASINGFEEKISNLKYMIDGNDIYSWFYSFRKWVV